MKELVIKIAAKWIAGIKGKQFEQVIEWVVRAGKNEEFKTGAQEAHAVALQYNAKFAQKASFVVRTIVQLAYFIARLRGLDT